ncbi:hypothetical protein DF186_20360, partial [Enterococcus hirae]
ADPVLAADRRELDRILALPTDGGDSEGRPRGHPADDAGDPAPDPRPDAGRGPERPDPDSAGPGRDLSMPRQPVGLRGARSQLTG